MEAAIVDASVAVKWLVQEPGSEQARLLSRARLEAPDFLPLECANILLEESSCSRPVARGGACAPAIVVASARAAGREPEVAGTRHRDVVRPAPPGLRLRLSGSGPPAPASPGHRGRATGHCRAQAAAAGGPRHAAGEPAVAARLVVSTPYAPTTAGDLVRSGRPLSRGTWLFRQT